MNGVWVRDENGALRRETIHRMGRRCRNWDYRCDAVYLITLVLADRSRPILGRLVIDEPAVLARGRASATAGATASATIDPETVKAHVELSELGRLIEDHWRKIGEFTPEIKPLALQLMPEHLHGVLWVRRNMKKPLGDALRGFKSGATKIYRAWLGKQGSPEDRWTQLTAGEVAPSPLGDGVSLFAPGYVDDILFDKQAFENGSAYVLDNARRLAVKRLFPEFFKVLRDVAVDWRDSPEDEERRARQSLDGQGGLVRLGRVSAGGRFAAIGNTFLLRKPTLLQVQCSRSDFGYRRARNAKGALELVKDANGNKVVDFTTAAFDEKLGDLLAAAKHGAVLVSPCVSDGEKEIAARAFAAGASVVTLQNKGFSPLYKPGGQLFERCAAGNLLMLAPAAWPYLPGEKKITRVEALTLNRIAQLICGTGSAMINYRGAKIGDVDAFVADAVAPLHLGAGKRSFS